MNPVLINGEMSRNGIPKCEPDEIALKSFFLGPKAENQEIVKELISKIFLDWFKWRSELYPEDGKAISEADFSSASFIEKQNDFREKLDELIHRFREEIPTFTPRYIGHMLTEISLPALLGHFITLIHNPNNITGEASRIGIKIEDEAIHELSKMVGFESEETIGHFTSGGTVANFEGMIRARSRIAEWLAVGCLAHTQGHQISLFEAAHMGWPLFEELQHSLADDLETIRPYHLLKSNPYDVARVFRKVFGTEYKGPVLLVPDNKHYSWEKAVNLIGLGDDAFWPIALDKRGKLNVTDLRHKVEKARSEQRPILMVVSVAGTTELGDFDPINEVSAYLKELADQEGIYIWHHIDAAYGGFFCSIDRKKTKLLSTTMSESLDSIPRANSMTIDPHKLGYVPYASGAFICKKRKEYYANAFHAPYINFEHLSDKGPQTIEGSRSAAGAVSTWLTAKTIGLNPNGYGRILERTIKERIDLEEKLSASSEIIRIAPHSETNIACFCLARPFEPTSLTNARTLKIFDAYSTSENHSFFVSKTTLGFGAYGEYLTEFLNEWHGQVNTDGLVLIRLTLMNPFFGTRETSIDYSEAFVKDLLITISNINDFEGSQRFEPSANH